MIYNICSGAIPWQIHDFLSDDKLYLAPFVRYSQNKKNAKTTLKTKVKVKEEKNWTYTISVEMFESI